jgi:hypothetical protein
MNDNEIKISIRKSENLNATNATQNRNSKNYLKETTSSLQKKTNKYANKNSFQPFFTTTKSNLMNTFINISSKLFPISRQNCKCSYTFDNNISYPDEYNHFSSIEHGDDPYNHFQ